MFEIEKSVPIPPDKKTPWPFADMEVGDSFSIPAQSIAKARVAASFYQRSHNVILTVRVQPDRSFRCWRVK